MSALDSRGSYGSQSHVGCADRTPLVSVATLVSVPESKSVIRNVATEVTASTSHRAPNLPDRLKT